MHAAQGPYIPTWDSLSRYQVPDWYQDGKFGIFIHWGVYSVPAFGNEWYPRNMYLQDRPEYQHHLETYGSHTQFGYKDFIPHFKAEKYDPDEWAELFRQAGARFVVPVAEHHDGFAMYDTKLSRWNAVQMGPKRDVIGDLAQAVRARDMVFGVSSHRAEHWWFMGGGMAFDSDVQDPLYRDFYGPAKPILPKPGSDAWRSKDWEPRPDAVYLDDWLARMYELVDNYQPQLVWFDWWIEQTVFQPYLQKFAAHYYNRGEQWDKGVAINFKFDPFPPGTAVYDIERGQLKEIAPFFWQNDTSLSKNSWGYIHNQDYKDSGDLIQDLVDVVSKNGALLLNIGPRPDGTIPEQEQRLLLEIGAWLRVNGEAIYNTRPWRVYGEGPTEVPEGSFTDTKRQAFTGQDIRFTTNKNAVYAILLGWPEESVTIHSLPETTDGSSPAIRSVQLLGAEGQLNWSRTAEGLQVMLPAKAPGSHAYCLKIAFEELLG